MLSEFTDDQKIAIKGCMGKAPNTDTMLKKALKNDELFDLLLAKKLLFEKTPAKGRRKARYDFNEEAKSLFSVVEIPKLKKAPRRKRAARPTIDAATIKPMVISVIEPYLKGFEARILALEKKIDTVVSSDSIKNSTTTRRKFNLDNFSSKLRTYYEKINTEERRGGMVPIPRLWDELRVDGFSRNDFVSGLFELERQRIIELQTASDPKVVRDAKKAINHPSRGLINYVIWRR